ncbi:hypothetical protein GCM10022224_095150 [Nonomuraea antimicrobica]|uniref:Uncharacterized protein n=1 Tax=Nonomuraea antimicrobica TaxID=561173 RepID=A0ABP7E813_9ACTN
MGGPVGPDPVAGGRGCSFRAGAPHEQGKRRTACDRAGGGAQAHSRQAAGVLLRILLKNAARVKQSQTVKEEQGT